MFVLQNVSPATIAPPQPVQSETTDSILCNLSQFLLAIQVNEPKVPVCVQADLHCFHIQIVRLESAPEYDERVASPIQDVALQPPRGRRDEGFSFACGNIMLPSSIRDSRARASETSETWKGWSLQAAYRAKSGRPAVGVRPGGRRRQTRSGSTCESARRPAVPLRPV